MHSFSAFSFSTAAPSALTPPIREYLYQQSLVEFQAMELRNVDELKAKVATVVRGNAHGILHTQQDRGRLAPAADTAMEATDASKQLVLLSTTHDRRGHQQSPPSRPQDALRLDDPDALIYNK